MILRYTKKAQKKLKLPRLTTAPESADLFDEWCVDVFQSDRYTFFLASNAATLFTVILHGRGIRYDADLNDSMFGAILEQMEDVSCGAVFEKRISPGLTNILLSNTNSRAILGSMNDMIVNAKYFLDHQEMSPFDAAKLINETPFKYLRMEGPNHCLRRYLV